jgi:hypothetical protein
MYGDHPDDDVRTRRDRRRWNREHRLRLLRAFPADRLSVEAKKLLDEEEIALPNFILFYEGLFFMRARSG